MSGGTRLLASTSTGTGSVLSRRVQDRGALGWTGSGWPLETVLSLSVSPPVRSCVAVNCCASQSLAIYTMGVIGLTW